jgi:glutaredoxin
VDRHAVTTGGGSGGPVRVVLYTIPGKCRLCDEAREVLHREGVAFSEVDIRTDRALLRAYREEIPVVTVDGRKAFMGRIDPGRLGAVLKTPH